jgi:hypothetical protein
MELRRCLASKAFRVCAGAALIAALTILAVPDSSVQAQVARPAGW